MKFNFKKHKFIIAFLLAFFWISNLCYAITLQDSEDKKVIYLTFDDGPARTVTNKVLDVLKENNCKATFFLVGNQLKGQEDVVKRIYDEGHSIGLHSYTHERAKIYASPKSFIDEMLRTQNEIYKITGDTVSILRFPFGCNNDSFKLRQPFLDSVHNSGLKIYDWNIDSGDGLNPHISRDAQLKNCKNAKNGSIILMHCGYVNKNSAAALPSIIKYFKDNGYEFKKIDSNTPELYKVRK